MSSGSMISKLLIIPPLVIGAGALWAAVHFREPPAQAPTAEQARKVRTLTVTKQDAALSIVGYGTVRPANVWTGVAQVAGEVIYVNPGFKRGTTLSAGTEVVKVAPDDYRLAIAEAEADIRSAEAKLSELEVSEQNTRELLAIEEESLALKEKEINAKKALLRRGNVAQLSFDAELRDLLAQKTKVQDLKNSLRLSPTQRAVQQEQISVSKSKLATAQLNLKRTVIKLPFDARIASVDVEVAQFVQSGSKIGSADAVADAEITAQYPLNQLRQFFDTLRAAQGSDGKEWASRQKFVEDIGLYSMVRLRTGETDAKWRGRVSRLNDTLDEQTRSIGLITVVDSPYGQARPGGRPPLVKGMFVEVALHAKPLRDQIVIPSHVLHGDKVYIVDADNRLEVRDVSTGYRGDGFVLISSGLKVGERIVVSDVFPATPGLLLEAIDDKALQAQLVQLVSAQETGQ